MDALHAAILGRRPGEGEPHSSGTIVEGVVHSVSAAGLKFTLPDWDDGKFVFGPAPWPKVWNTQFATDTGTLVIGSTPYPHTHEATATETIPVKGDRCLVVFVGAGVENPWVVMTWPK